MAKNKYNSLSYSLPTGYNLGSYQIGHILGYGNFGITYFARNRHSQHKFAIKELYPSHSATRNKDGTVSTTSDLDYEEAVKRFNLEASVLQRLDHPNLVKLVDHFHANGTSYIVMDYQSGYNLKHHIEAGHGGPNGKLEQFCDFFYPLLESIEYMHSKGLLHRDIKPQNIFVAPGNQPILLDFGSTVLCPRDGVTPPDIQYSLPYAPPEQVADQTLGHWSDTYAIAAVMYYSLTKTLPPASNSSNYFSKMVETMKKFESSVPSPLFRVILSSLANDFKVRNKSTQSILEVVSKYRSKSKNPFKRGLTKMFKL